MDFEKSTYRRLVNLQGVCLEQGIPFVSYRLPLHTEIKTLVQHASEPAELSLAGPVDNLSGFVMSPFSVNARHGAFLLEPDSTFSGDNIEPAFIEWLSGNKRFVPVQKNIAKEMKTTPETVYIHQVATAIKEMEAGKFHKVVLSKIRVENLEENFDIPGFYLKLCEKYRYAFVYLIQLPGAGCWLGASPEPLLLVEGETVKTVSLAGTQLASESKIGPYVWSEKEIEEQCIVTDFVEKTLRSLGVREFTKEGPVNFRAANLIHLQTSFEFPKSELGDGLGKVLNALHPTPSVGGLPKTEACHFISSNEAHDRDYYTGFLGPLNVDGKTALYVNLRCLQLFDKQFVLYSGAGITMSSIAEREWEETDNKMLTMLNVMKG
ncbi:MAG TPA: isochorismate synthase [Paludibacter sp.]|nr:isochorismate synthase [Paludibacter sp.]